MARKDYIEKINQNLEHLTKDELKDVSILTTAQFDVRLKVAEKEYIEKEIANLTPQLQQQALPVVPEDVDEAIKYLKNHNNSTFSDLGDILTNKGFKWLNDFQFKDRRFGFGGLNNKLFILSHLAITGYEVEKPQLFYLKHIDMSKRDKDNDYFAQIRNDRFEHNSVKSDTFPQPEIVGVRFTQSEIDSMQTGSYEKIEVAE